MSRYLRTLIALACAALVCGIVVGCQARHTASSSTTTASAAPIPVGSTGYSLRIGGLTRTYHVYRPAGVASAAPLVVFLHGGFGSGEQAEQYYGWDAEADAHGFLVAYPDGYDRAWNVGDGCCGQPASRDIDDVAFISAMVTQIEREAPVDTRRVFATGISNGGMMDYRLACSTTIFAAIGPDSATELGTCAAPARISVIHIHGTADHNIPYNGGPGDGYAHIDGPAVPTVIATWRQVDGCASSGSTTSGVVTTSVAHCPDGRSVTLITIAGAGHQWPGSPDRPLIQKALGLDTPSTALNATAVIWSFFAGQA